MVYALDRRKSTGLLVAALCAAWAMPVLASDWVKFNNESASRISAQSSLVLTDPEEKDYAWGDLDKDGFIDLVIVRKQPFTSPGARRNVLLMNEGGVLVDRTNQYATAATDGGQGFLDLTNDRDVVLADVNNDGWLDVITATTISDGKPKTIGHPRVYMNLGKDANGNWLGLRYEEPRIPTMLSHSGASGHNPRFCSLAAGDLNGDGYPDLYFGDYDASGAGGSGQPAGADFNNKLLFNKGASSPGFFDDVTMSKLTFDMRNSAFGGASVIADMNNDGINDIVKQTALNPPQHIAITYNKYKAPPSEQGTFTHYQVVMTEAPYFVSVGDLNNNGWLDLVVTDDFVDHYWLSNGNPNASTGVVTFAKKLFPNQTQGFGSQSVIEDLNNDGWKDVLIADVDVDIGGCTRTSDILRNNGNAPNVTFSYDPANIPTNMLVGVHNFAVFDINNDGWLDIVVGRCSSTQVWMNDPPVGVTISYPAGIPGQVEPQTPYDFQVAIDPAGGTIAPGSAKLHVAVNGGAFTAYDLTGLGNNLFKATLPSSDCTAQLTWYVTVTVGVTPFKDPANAPQDVYLTDVSLGTFIAFVDAIEGDVSGWTIINDPSLTGGAWEKAVPIGSVTGTGKLSSPSEDNTQGAQNLHAFVTQNPAFFGQAASAHDVDFGPTHLISPTIDLGGSDADISFAYWMFSEGGNLDTLNISVSNDDGQSWTSVGSLGNFGDQFGGLWNNHTFRVSDYVTPTANVKVRFSVTDTPNDSITEAGVDDFLVQAFLCGDEPFVNAFPPNNAIDARQPSNIDGSGVTGWSSITLTFPASVDHIGASDFALSQQGGLGSAPSVVSVVPVGGSDVEVTFSGSINPKAWTTLTHVPSGATTRLGYLPGDVSSDGIAAVADVLKLIDHLNGVVNLPIWSTDIDRSGVVGSPDVLRVIDLLNGAGAFDVYLGATLPN